MNIAIIGAGLAGLSCAHELERYGVSPVIYEDTDFIGDREQHVSAMVNVADRPITDYCEYFSKKCHLKLKPVNIINRLTHHSPNNTTIINGDNFGYFYKRGKEKDSLKVQLYSQLSDTKILFGQKPDYKELSKEYDHVVIANGQPDMAKELGCWTDLIQGWIKGTVVFGNFDPNELVMWINRDYCKNGYAYLCPYGTKRASLSLFVPDIGLEEIEYYWDRFLRIEKIKYDIVEEFYVQHFSGSVYPHHVGNIYLTGAAGGAISPFLGFGQSNSITMGVLAAQSIIQGLSYDELIKTIVKKEKAFYEMRKSFDTLTNSGYDYLLTTMGLPGIRQLIYHTNINVIKYGAKILRAKDRLLKK